jgi:hypothetical protein
MCQLQNNVFIMPDGSKFTGQQQGWPVKKNSLIEELIN